MSVEQVLARGVHLLQRVLLLLGDRAGDAFLEERGVAHDGRERRAQLVRDVLQELVFHAPRLERVRVLLLELAVGRRERRVRAFEILNETRLLGRRRHLIRHHSDQVTRVAPDRVGRREVERHCPEHGVRRLQRQRDERTEAQLPRHLAPVVERRVLKDVQHFDRATLGRGDAARSVAESHAHLAEELRVAPGPIVDGREPHEIAAVVHDVHAAERRADERTDAVERELENLFRALRRDERVDDLASRHELAEPDISVGATVGRRRHRRRHVHGN